VGFTTGSRGEVPEKKENMWQEIIIIIIIIIIIGISFTRKTYSIHFDYHLGNAVITRTDCVKDLGVWLDNTLYFHHHVNYIFSVASKLVGLIISITYNFSSLDSIFFYISLVLSKLEYVSIAWNNLTRTDSNKLKVYIRTLHSRRRHLDVLFLINVLITLMTASLFRIPSKLIRDFSIFSVSRALKSSPSARFSTVANKFTHLWIFLALRLFRWTIYCVMLVSLLLCLFDIFIVFVFTPVLLRNWPF
jgi:hypothetical protein